MNLSESISLESWEHVSVLFNRYFSILLLIFGVLGNVLNILVLSQHSLRSNSCVCLFLFSSLFNLISIIVGLTTRIVAEWAFDLTETIGWLCRSRIFLLVTSRTIAMWLLVLAAVDRWLLSSRNATRRRMSSLRNAKLGSYFISFSSVIIYLPIFYCHDANLKTTPLKCYSRTIQCQLFVNHVYTMITTVLPLVFMFFFGFLTMRNIVELTRRQRYSSYRSCGTLQFVEQRTRLTTIDRNLLFMLLVQITFLALLTLPQALVQIYTAIIDFDRKNNTERIIYTAIYKISILLTYLASGIPFYIYTLTGGELFREAISLIIQRFKRTLLCFNQN